MAKKKPEIIGYIDADGKFDSTITMPTTMPKSLSGTTSTPTISNTTQIKSVQPTVQSSFGQPLNNITNFNQTTQTVPQTNKLSTPQYFGLAAKTGLVGGLTSIPQAPLQEMERSLKKGEAINSPLEVGKQIISGLNRATSPDYIGIAKSYIQGLKNVWGDQNKDIWSKLFGTGVEAADTATKMAGVDMGRYADIAYPFIGALDKGASNRVSQIRETINQPSKQLQEEFAQASQGRGTIEQMVGQGIQAVGNMAPSVAASAITGNPDIGLITMMNSAKAQATQEALDKGASLDEAIKIGNAKALVEYGTERMTGGLNVFGKGALDDVTEKVINDNIKNGVMNFLAKQGVGVGGEILEEITSDVVGTLIDKGTIDPNKTYTWDDLVNTVGPTAISTVILNALTGGYGGRAYRQNLSEMNNIQDSVAKTADALNLGRTQLNKKVSPTAQQTQQETVQEVVPQAQKEQTKPITQETQNVSQTANNEEKIQNFRDSVTRENIQDAEGFYKAVEKIISDKDYNVIMDSSIKNADGKPVNASISNENGITIRINPNSERAGEILLMHEVTHGIETKEISDLIMNYASKNSEFNTALEDLKKTYGTEDITPEVVADISGQLFGNQEFINNLSVEKPSVFKKIYDKIIEIANKITGNSKQALFVRDLANKWQKAYRESTIESSQQTLKEATRYSLNSEIEEMNNMFNKNIKTNKTTNNEGQKLSKGQQEFFKDVSPEVRDKNGGLKKVYHTVNHPIVQFNEFNPVGTPGYRFGNQVVVYATPSKEMSGSYADQNYEMADTVKLNNVQEAKDWLFEVGLPFYEIENNTVYDEDGAPILKYKSENELLRNIKSDISEEEGYKSNLQYEGYLNIKNPFVVESDGADWDKVSEIYDEKCDKLYNDTVKNKKQALIDLVSESKQKKITEYEDKKIRQQIELNSDILNNFKDKRYNIFEKLNVGKDITELHPLIRDAKNYDDFVKRAKEYNIELPDANTKLFELIDRDVFDHYLENENIKVDLATATIEDFVNNLIKLYETEGVYGEPDRYFWFNMEKVFGDNAADEIIPPADWIYAVDNDFSKEVKETLQKKPLTTNDVVKYVIAENQQRPDNEKYDGVVFKNIYDYGGEAYEETPQDVYAIFNSNQFKAADNLNPTNDPDIRYSQNSNKWQEFLEKHFKSSGTTTNLKEKVGKEPTITAKNTSGKQIKLKQDKTNKNVYTREEQVKADLKDINNQFKNQSIKAKDGREISNFYSNITQKSKFIDTDIRNMFKNEDDLKFYNRVSNEEALNKANKEIGNTAKSQEKAFNDFIGKQGQFNSIDMAKGWIFLERFQEAGDYDRAYLVAKQMKEKGTQSGQAIQILNLQSRLTPEGMYRWATNELLNAEQAFNSEKGRTKKEIEKYRDSFRLTGEEVEFIKSQMEKVQNMPDGDEKNVEIAKINSMLQDKLPHTKGQSIKSWMRIAMLLNPKTQVRNVMGNAMIAPVNTLADVFAGAADRYVSKKTGKRTIGGPSLGGLASYGKGTVKGVKQGWRDYKLGIDSRNVQQNRFDVGQGKAFNEQHTGPFKEVRNAVAKSLNKINDLLGMVMDVGDRAFLQGSIENSLYNQQKLNNSKEITKEMMDIAEMEGVQRTWNDNNEYTKAVLDLRKAINQIGNQMHIHIGEYGLGDLLIPFAKTPANLTKAIVDYSPLGYLNAITEGKNLKRAIETENYTPQMQHDFAQSLGKATAGSLLYALGAALAKAKITTGNSDEDKDLKRFMRYNLGIQPYSIKLGDKSFTYDWAQPIAAPFAITADIEKGMSENMTAPQAVQHFLTTGFNILSAQSFLSGINEVLNDNDGILSGIEQQIVNMPATAIPTFLKQITDMFDGTKRQTYSKEGQVANMVKTAKSKVPGLSETLSPQVDVLGNEIEKYGGDNSIFNVFFNPSNMEKGNKTPVAEEIYSLYEATQDKTIIPKKVDYSTKINGEKKILTTDEMAAWQKASGKMVTDEVERAMKNSDYKKMTDDGKAAVIKKIVDYSYQKAKSETFSTPLANSYKSQENAAKKRGMEIADYYISTTRKK